MTRYLLAGFAALLLFAGMPAAAQEQYNTEALWGTWADDLGNTYYQCFSRWGFSPFDEETASTKYYILFRIDASDEGLQSLWYAHRYPDVSGVVDQPSYHRQ